MSGLEKRLEALERSVDGTCPKCLGVLVGVVNGKLRSATRRGEPRGPRSERRSGRAARGARLVARGF